MNMMLNCCYFGNRKYARGTKNASSISFFVTSRHSGSRIQYSVPGNTDLSDRLQQIACRRLFHRLQYIIYITSLPDVSTGKRYIAILTDLAQPYNEPIVSTSLGDRILKWSVFTVIRSKKYRMSAGHFPWKYVLQLPS